MNAMLTLPRRLGRDRSGVAMVEFAYTLPIFVLLMLAGTETANYTITRMRVSQLALQIADNAARMGTGTQFQAKTINESDINDIFVGAQKQGGKLDLLTNGRIILSDLEADGTNYTIKWQRCYGAKAHASAYGTQGQTGLAGIGPATRQITIAQPGGATMFVEVYYDYKPLLVHAAAPGGPITEVAGMAVRDRRDLSQVYNTNGASVAAC